MLRKKEKRGFTLVEMLLAIALVSALLAAVAGAIHACLFSYQENDEIASVTQTARVVMARMSRDIRTANDVELDGSGTTLTIAANEDCPYDWVEYVYSDGQLTYQRSTDALPVVLLGGNSGTALPAFAFTPTLDATNTYIRSITIEMTLMVDNQAMPVVTSAAIRRQGDF